MDIALLPHQHEALTSPFKNTLLLGGVGSGKTFAGIIYALKQVSEQPEALGFIGANTYQQLRDVCVASLISFLETKGIPYRYNKVDSIIWINETKILLRSLDKPDNFRGVEIGWYWLDEVAFSKKESYDIVVGRLRDKKANRLHGLLTTTPKGFNWLYDYFHPSGELHSSDFHFISAPSDKNRHLPDGYLDSLKSQYDDKMIEQELEGKFVNIFQGAAYYAFDRDHNVQEFREPQTTAFVGMDFNVDPMTAVIGYYMNDKIYIWDEVFLRNSDTFEISTVLRRMNKRMKIIPDSTGANRKTSGKSDHIILKEAGFEIMGTRNPFVMDRVNCVNRLLRDKRLIIHPRCKKLINDLEKVTWKEGKNDLDKTTDKLLTHISDSLGYLCNKLDPIKYGKAQNITFS